MLEQAYLEWQKRDRREADPNGDYDNDGRWYPAEEEEQDCCKQVLEPSRAFPYSLLAHCRSGLHVAALFGVKAIDLRRLVYERRRWH